MRILSINCGSSSIKFTLYGEGEKHLLSGKIERIGLMKGRISIRDLVDQEQFFPDHGEALFELFKWVKEPFDAVSHRIVHGGPKYRSPQLVDNELITTLKKFEPFDPDHLPDEIKAIEVIQKAYPSVPQVVCFDTAFHADIPDVAKHFAIPRKYWDEGVYRYGFHGLSYEYVLQELGDKFDRVIIAHLGNGCSMAAIKSGKCVDTSMGFTPLGGLVMSSRSGDLDPGVLIYLLKGMSSEELSRVLNKESGLLGISGMTSDMKDLLDSEEPRAKEAVDIFCYQAKKFIGGYSAILGGVDRLVFTGGIGENAASIRKRIANGIPHSVIPTNEELMLARHANKLLNVD